MANTKVITIVLLFALVALTRIDPSSCQMVKGRVSCLDCTNTHQLSDIKVSVKCEGVKNMAVATTEDDGSFNINIPSSYHTKNPSSLNCLAKILGGPVQLYTSRKNQISQVIKGKDQNSYTISTPLNFLTSCPKNTECNKAQNQVGSSKTVDLPLPREWGLAPSSYYVPFIPIIGIP